MSAAERKERERAERHALILRLARQMAEAEGWEAVTTRRLADKVEYSQPVLYSHFASREAIVRAVALEGFAELAETLARARQTAPAPRQAVRAVCAAYLDFAARQTALYQAMLMTPAPMGEPRPGPLRAAFGELVSALTPYAARPDLYAEVIWGALHGMAALAMGGRITPEGQPTRLNLLIEQVELGWRGTSSA